VSQAHEIVDFLLEALDIDMDRFARDAGITVSMDDFVIDSHPDRFGRWSTGNTNYAVYYKHLKIKGKPVYLGSVMGCHDYNRTGHAGAVSFHITVPSRRWEYNPQDNQGRYVLKKPKQRTNYGWGAVHMNKPEQFSFDSLFDACVYLLSLLRRSRRLTAT
jgi:hypothetical protein